MAKISDTKDDWLLFAGPPIKERFEKTEKKKTNRDKYH